MVPLLVERPVTNGFHQLLRSSLCPCPCSSIRSLFFHRRKMFLRLAEHRNSYPFLHTTANISSPNATGRSNNEKDFWDDYDFVEVIGIGSRKEAVLDFCLESVLRISSLRFWQIVKHDSLKVQLLQRFIEKDYTPRMIDVPLSLQSCSKAVILSVKFIDRTILQRRKRFKSKKQRISLEIYHIVGCFRRGEKYFVEQFFLKKYVKL